MKVAFGNTVFDCRAVAFDKDGTLLDSHRYWRQIVDLRERFLAELAGEQILPPWRLAMGLRGEGETFLVDPNGPLATATTADETVMTASILYTQTGWVWSRCREAAAEAFRQADAALRPEKAFVPLPGASSVLVTLLKAGVKVGVVTSDDGTRAKQGLELLGAPEGTFLVAATDVRRSKPWPDMMEMASSLTGVPGEDFVVIGDSLADVRLARAVGAKSVAICHRNLYTRQEIDDLSREADATIESLWEIGVLG